MSRILLFILVFCLSLVVASSESWSQSPNFFDTTSYEQDTMTNPETEVIYDIQKIREEENQYEWLFYTLLIPLVIFAYHRYNFGRDLSELFNGFFNYNLFQQLHREQELSISLSAILLSLNFFLVIGHYIFLLMNHYGHELPYSGIPLLITLVGGLMALYTLRYLGLKVIEHIFPIREEISSYSFNIFMVNKVIGVLFLPIAVIIAFTPDYIVNAVIIPSFVLYFSLIIFRYFRGLKIGNEYFTFHKFHFFVYFCTLEIAPVFILLRVLDSWGFF